MSVVARPGARRRAERLLADEYEQRKGEVLRTVAAKLAAAGVRAADLDLDAAYNDAWHALYVTLREGEPVERRTGLLVTIAHRRALDEHRALRARPHAGGDALEALGVEPDVVARLDDARRLRLLVEGMRERLDRRERQAAGLCWLYGCTRPEAARAMGVTPRRMEKLMDRVTVRLRELVGEIDAGERCAAHASLMRAYAVGLLDEGGERHRLARDHLDGCPACRRHVLMLRGIAAVAPPAPLLLGALEAAGTIGGAAGVGTHAGAAGAVVPAQAAAGPVAGAGAGLGVRAVAAGPLAGLGAKVAIGASAAAVAVAAVVAIPGGAGPSTAARTAEAPAQPGAAASTPASSGTPAAGRAGPARRPAARRARDRRAASPRHATTTASSPAGPAPAPAQPAPATPEPAPAAPAPAAPAPADPPVRDGAEEFELR